MGCKFYENSDSIWIVTAKHSQFLKLNSNPNKYLLDELTEWI